MKLAPTDGAAWRRALLRVSLTLATLLILGASALAWLAAMPGSSHNGPVPALTPAQQQVRARLEADVRFLSVELGVRHSGEPVRLARAATRIAAALAGPGRTVRQLPFRLGKRVVANVEATQLGTVHPDKILVLGAHYDTAPHTPGADDNATGVATLLELARGLRGVKLPYTVRFVAFVNEEPPYFQTPEMGSLVYADGCRKVGDQVVAMLSLESLGYYDTTPGSQSYPPYVGWLFPEAGDFVAFVGRTEGRALVRRAIGLFRQHAKVPSEGLAAPARLQGIDWSDHWSFWQRGYPAIMVSDTAVMRNPHYHRPTDYPPTLDWLRFTHVVEGLRPVVVGLAGGAP